MAYLDDLNNRALIGYRVEDAIVPLAHAVPFLSRQFLGSGRAWILRQAVYSIKDSLDVSPWNAAQVFRDRWPEN